ncbi:MAG: Rne/Rng family ribonuclease [Bacteroidia bacterium]|nr:Rne/Rng family ribonuclease [Bacteroidia bacterium]MDW8088966.1 Rne/Rng family ribonuclease [Bacteroidia bacterium]
MRELVLLKEGEVVKALLFEHKQLVEYYQLRAAPCKLGDIFLGQVTQVVRGLNAAFVDLGLSREGFLHYSDLAWGFSIQRAWVEALRRHQPLPPPLPLAEGPLPKEGQISSYLKPGDWIIVQVVKEMVDNKGPRLTTQIALTGQTVVMLPFSPEVGISHRITEAGVRQVWKEALQQIHRPPYGIILRTGAQALPLHQVEAEYLRLIQRWEELMKRLVGQLPPRRLTEAELPLHQLLQDVLSPPPQVIHTTDEPLYQQIQQFLRTAALSPPPALRFHRRRQNLESLFELERSVRNLLGRTVTLPNGGYLVIEHTEALHVIDVNTGSLAAQTLSPEELVLQTNLLAAQEIARQLRLRDLGGIVIIDFIDMKNPDHRQKVYERLREAMRTDKARHTILPMSEFGLVQLTRQRRRAPLELPQSALCSLCKGSGQALRPEALLLHLQQMLQYWASAYPRLFLKVRLHPFWVAIWAQKYRWHGSWVWNLLPHRWTFVEPDSELTLTEAVLQTLEGKVIVTLG